MPVKFLHSVPSKQKLGQYFQTEYPIGACIGKILFLFFQLGGGVHPTQPRPAAKHRPRVRGGQADALQVPTKGSRYHMSTPWTLLDIS